MKLHLIVAVALLATLTGWADTNVVTTAAWVVDGSDDAGPSAKNIQVLVDKVTVGSFSELKFYYHFGGTNAIQVFSVKGSGDIQPSLPPPGVPGGFFQLTGYQDCDEGFVGSMAITEMAFHSRSRKNSPLKVRARISNNDSLESPQVDLKFFPALTNSLSVDVKYRLTATRDICIETIPGAQQEFQIVRMMSNYVSPETNQNDRIWLIKLNQQICDPYTGCHTDKSSLCANLSEADGLVFGKARPLAKPTLALLHTGLTPNATPALAVDFRAPRQSQVKGQGFLTVTDDPTAANVSVWGNWTNARNSYKAGRRVGRFHYVLRARDPNNPKCSQVIHH